MIIQVEGTAAWDAHHSWLICFRGVTNGWIQNISSYAPNRQNLHMLSNGTLLRFCRGVTLYRVSMTNAQYGGAGGNGYMIRFNEANECMAVECEVGFCRHGIVQWRMENSGNVFLRNYDHDTGFEWTTGAGTSAGASGSDHHGRFSFSNLFDGNTIERILFPRRLPRRCRHRSWDDRKPGCFTGILKEKNTTALVTTLSIVNNWDMVM